MNLSSEGPETICFPMAPNSTVVVAHMEGISMRTGSHPPLAVTWPCRLHIEATRWRDGPETGFGSLKRTSRELEAAILRVGRTRPGALFPGGPLSRRNHSGRAGTTLTA
jgi:hypothetical protein